jgi:hypothetical protein
MVLEFRKLRATNIILSILLQRNQVQGNLYFCKVALKPEVIFFLTVHD